jgi:hypothetical protein
MLDLKADLDVFFNPDEFGAQATIALPDCCADISGTPSTYAERDRAGSNTNSGISAFMVGAADIDVQAVQFLTAWHCVAAAVVECTLTIHQGEFAGDWRVRAIERDGDIARLLLNQR